MNHSSRIPVYSRALARAPSVATALAPVLALALVPAIFAIFPNASRAQVTVTISKTQRAEFESLARGCPVDAAARLEKLRSYFRESGCPEDRIATTPVKGLPEPNLIVTLPGQSESTILVGAHFDYSTAGNAVTHNLARVFRYKGTGFIDDWSGALLLPVLYSTLNTRQRQHTFIFLGFTGEEKGFKGSKSYARQMPPDAVARTKAMIYLDCLGLDTTAAYVEQANPKLWEYLGRAAQATKLPLRGAEMPPGFPYDADAFRKLKIPTILIHSTSAETVFTPRTFLDSVDSMHWQEYYDSYVLIAAYLAYLDAKLK